MKPFLMLLLVFTTHSFAENMNNFSRKGIIIRPIEHTSNQLEYKEGENAYFEGEICAVSEGFLKNGKEQCRQLNGNLEIKAFFPDPTVDVTDKVKITKRSQSYHYSYETQELNAGEGNALTLLVGPVSNQTKKLLAIKAKLDRRIDLLKKKILKHELTQKHSYYLDFLVSLKIKLENISDKIQGVLDKENIAIAKLTRPLQVESDTPAAYYYHSTFDDKIFSLSIPEGLPRIGETLRIDAKVTTVRKQDLKKQSHNESFQLKLLVDERVVYESERFVNSEIETFAFSHSLTDHKEGVSRRVKLELYSVKDLGNGKHFKTVYDLEGKLELSLPAPLPRIDKVPPRIDLALQDNLRLNNNKVLLTGSVTDDSDAGFAIFLNNQLIFENDTKIINRELSLNQGVNTIRVRAQDIWGNKSEVTRTVDVDSIVPMILPNQNIIKLTNQVQLLIQAQILEASEVSTRILHNGQEVLTTNSKLIIYSLNLDEGQNSIRIESVDSFGNTAVPFDIAGIILDTTPPLINFSYAPTIPNPDQEIILDASASLDANGISKFSLLANDVLLASSSASALKFKIQNSGDHQITLKVEDKAGNSAFLVKTIHVNKPPIASLIANPSSGAAPLIVELDASASSDDGALIYHFDFGDGSQVLVTSSSKVTHEYQVGSYNASVKVVDQNGLEAVSVTKIDATEVQTEAVPQIHIVTKNNFKLHSNYLKGEIIELDASYSQGGVGEIVKYEWKKGDQIIGREVNVILPNADIGTQEYSLKITNSNNLSSQQSFSISISPEVIPEINIGQSNIYAPSQVTISLINSNDFVGIKKISWKNLYTLEESFNQTLSQTLYHVGETRFEVIIEDTLGYVYKKEFIVMVESDGPYIEGPSKIDVIPGTDKKVKYFISKDTNTTIELKEAIAGVSINEYGDLLFNVPENFSGPGVITLIASNGLRVFEKEISINWVHSSLLATIPAGFFGEYTIHAPNSILDNTSIELTENMISNPTAINVLEAKSTDGTYLIFKALSGEIIKPLKITTSGDIEGRHQGTNNSISDWFSPILFDKYYTKIKACSGDPIFFKRISAQHLGSALLSKSELETKNGMNVIALGKRFELKNLNVPEEYLLKSLAISFSNVVNDSRKTIYIIEDEGAINWKATHANGFVLNYDDENIFINIDTAINYKKNYSTPLEVIDFFTVVLKHETRHSQLNALFGCKRNEIDKTAFKFIEESEAEHFSLKTANEDERIAYLKHGHFSKYINSNYFNLAAKSIEDSFNLNFNRIQYSEYLFAGIWDLISADDFFRWLISQGREYKHSPNTQVFSDYLGGELSFADFLMHYEYKLIFPLESNELVINHIAQGLTKKNENIFTDYNAKDIKKVQSITLNPFSATLRTIRREYLVKNNLINADGVAFVETIADRVEDVYAKLRSGSSDISILKGELQGDPAEFNRVSIPASDCEQCDLLFSNLSLGEQTIEVLIYGATKIVSDPRNKLWPTNGTTITWDGTMYIKHYQPYSEITEENAIHSRVDVGNSLYINHLAPVYIWDCGNGGESWCGYKLISNLSIDNNYVATLKSDTLGTCGFYGACYNISVLQLDSFVLSEPLFQDFVKFFTKGLFQTAYAQDFIYPVQRLLTPEEVLGVTVEDKRQIKNENNNF